MTQTQFKHTELGPIPEHWEMHKLGNFLTIFSEKGFPNAQLLSVTREQGVILRDRDNKEENHNYVPDDLGGYKHLCKGDFVINKMKSWQGSYGVSNYEGIVSPAYFTCKLKGVNRDFFSRAIRSKVYSSYFMKCSKGIRVDQWDLDPIQLKYIPFALPPLSEQEAIVAYLDEQTGKIDQAIEREQKMIDLLNERKQIIIQQAVTKGLNPNAPLKHSGIDWIGQIPQHWEVTRLQYLTSFAGRIGFRGYGTEDLTDEDNGAITLSPSNMKNGKMNYTKCSYLKWSKYYESPEIMVFNGDILFVKTGSTYGKTALVNNLPKEATINPQLLILKNIKSDSRFLTHVLSTPFIQNQVERIVIGGTIPTISQEKIGNLCVFCPPTDEQRAIVDYISSATAPIDQAIAAKNKLIFLLQERKQIIINEVVTGKIKVS